MCIKNIDYMQRYMNGEINQSDITNSMKIRYYFQCHDFRQKIGESNIK